MWVTSSLTTALVPTAVALGNFDGVHLGHRQVIQPILAFQRNASGKTVYSTVVTFHPHPQEFFSGEPRSSLTPISEKVGQLKAMGVDQLVLLPFDRELANLSPEQFVEQVLIQNLKAQWISVGFDFCFGHRRAGKAEDLQAIAARNGIEVTIAPLKAYGGARISSSAIRQTLREGNIELSNKLLGRSYCLIGTVVQGQQLGRKLGFPTANLHLPPDKFLPRDGVYAVQVQTVEDNQALSLPASLPLPGVMNIGYRPTVDGKTQTVEVHLLDWFGNLYGKTLMVSLKKFLRPEQKFQSVEDLKKQIQADCESARMLLIDTGVSEEGSID